MKKRSIVQIIIGAVLIVVFVLFTISLTCVEKQPIGPYGSSVAYATVNGAIHSFLGVNMTLYNITDWGGLVPIFIALTFAIVGLVQWIKRKNILKVDSSILLLGVYYVIVFSAYIFFEFVVINRRPVLINGYLEASYPSSTTMLAMCVMPSAILQLNRVLQNKIIKISCATFCISYEIFMVAGRLLSGVHWFTDVLGGGLFSTGILLIYIGLNNYLPDKDKKEEMLS